ncbi:acyl-CoA thioester hydrolase [Endobacter medicaginis]|uniref:Acyl-CoA thioester hydrolase n=1 Tax=Endobacter medicaginis TaxID=1181271 RepID=A0A839UYV3_9PROT|nr:thioesterase family protein [Endobacter medicaginis]MBB3172481.1 acyl-CoA thioester hydrolase [Endobacter medicaginis]MCX5474030.1 thioesterase family protein [Endobacter medicaginis]NVN30709.1 acyl-CoA thioesterase [Endobacter medicaginis]
MSEPTPAPARPEPLPRSAYGFTIEVPTAYTDQDTNGHINNTAYYRFADTVIALFRMRHDLLAEARTMVTVENGARYLSETHFPDVLTVGLRVDRLGRSSLTYRIGIFQAGSDRPAAEITSAQVWIDTVTRRPVAIDGAMRQALEAAM